MFWDDFLTGVPNPDSLLVPGAPVTATLTLDLHFENSLLAINNAAGWFSYELFAGIVTIDPVTGARLDSTTVLDDCLIVDPDPNHRSCSVGSQIVDIPANTSGQPLSLQFAPIALPIAIGQPFELGAGLSFEGECNVGPNDTAISSCSFDGDALHTSVATLQPLGDFTLDAASGHDYSVPVSTPPGSVPEPGSLALIVSGLAAAVLSLGRRKKVPAAFRPASSDLV
ncbi:MAG TPA: PEP-CTERM sorting domain-containing protein [Casimicrobiaceae bacterium]|nr:PEP-CTERM sorting domain-containing protein [Casimicrobiaceae bacterium]